MPTDQWTPPALAAVAVKRVATAAAARTSKRFMSRISIFCARDERACMNNAPRPPGVDEFNVAQRKGTMPGVSGGATHVHAHVSEQAAGPPRMPLPQTS